MFKNINWKVRIKNRTFWIAFVPAMLLLVQEVANLFGFVIDLSDIGGKLLDIIEALFVVLALIGVVTDPTTSGFRQFAGAYIRNTKEGIMHEQFKIY